MIRAAAAKIQPNLLLAEDQKNEITTVFWFCFVLKRHTALPTPQAHSLPPFTPHRPNINAARMLAERQLNQAAHESKAGIRARPPPPTCAPTTRRNHLCFHHGPLIHAGSK